MTEITVQLPDGLFAIVKQAAQERGISIEEFIRQCIEDALAIGEAI
jgi:predicted DNA binding CopG/RHH family protein